MPLDLLNRSHVRPNVSSGVRTSEEKRKHVSCLSLVTLYRSLYVFGKEEQRRSPSGKPTVHPNGRHVGVSMAMELHAVLRVTIAAAPVLLLGGPSLDTTFQGDSRCFEIGQGRLL